MLETVLTSDWILVVADIATQLKEDFARIPVTAPPDQVEGDSTAKGNARRRLAGGKSRAQRQNALRTADTRLQRADPQYATRADTNLAHFLLARPDTNLDPYAYAELTLPVGSELNAIGVWGTFHFAALQKASRLAREKLTPEERRKLVRAMLFDEVFALHFLEDTHAAGHVAGCWGDVSQRKGTHDFYNANSIEVFTWKGRDKTIILMGDSHMRPEDVDLAAKAEQTSLEQVLDAASGRSRGYEFLYTPKAPAPRRKPLTSAGARPSHCGIRVCATKVDTRQLSKRFFLADPSSGLGCRDRRLAAFSQRDRDVRRTGRFDRRARYQRWIRVFADQQRLGRRARHRFSRRVGAGGGAGECERWTGVRPDRFSRRFPLHKQGDRDRIGGVEGEPECGDPGALWSVHPDPDAVLSRAG